MGIDTHPVDAVLLDAAGTLIRPREPVGATYTAVAARFGVELDPDVLSRAFIEVFAGMPDLAFDWTSTAELERRERAWWRTLVKRVIGLSGGHIQDFEGLFTTLYGHYAQGAAWECYREVPSVLDTLRSMGCKLAVVSNFDSRLVRILDDLGIGERMDAVVYSSKAGWAKPDPAIFRVALAALGVVPQRALHVGDSTRADVAGAAAAGIVGLLLERGPPGVTANCTPLGSLSELPQRLVMSRQTGMK